MGRRKKIGKIGLLCEGMRKVSVSFMLRSPCRFIAVWLLFGLMSPWIWAGTALDSQMNTMKGALRSLKIALQAPSESEKAKYIGYADTLISAATKAKELEPQMTSKIPEAERAQFVADYQKSIEDLIALFAKLKEQLNAGDWEAAKNQIRLINRAQGQGHEKFRDDRASASRQAAARAMLAEMTRHPLFSGPVFPATENCRAE